jgi:hypothetical protein
MRSSEWAAAESVIDQNEIAGRRDHRAVSVEKGPKNDGTDCGPPAGFQFAAWFHEPLVADFPLTVAIGTFSSGLTEGG